MLRMGTKLNVLPRLSIASFLGDVLHRNDSRFTGKAIPMQDLIVDSGLSLVCRAQRCVAQPLGALSSVVRRLESVDFLAGDDGQLVQPVRQYLLRRPPPISTAQGPSGLCCRLPSVCMAGLIDTAVHSGLYTLVREAGHLAW
jgi:hypothetical protein